MDEGAFDQNFCWYEWGFVSPAEMPREEVTVRASGNRSESSTPRMMALRLLEHWDEEHRWPT
jgi:hypothetical protein